MTAPHTARSDADATHSLHRKFLQLRVYRCWPRIDSIREANNSELLARGAQRDWSACGINFEYAPAPTTIHPIHTELPEPKLSSVLFIKNQKSQHFAFYSTSLETTPAPTVLPPSRMANRSPTVIGILLSSSMVHATLSPGITICTSSGSMNFPVTSAVRM